MSSSSHLHDSSKPPPSSSEGARAAWGCLIGAVLGALAGAWAGGHWLKGALALGAVGWVAGALLDRARR